MPCSPSVTGARRGDKGRRVCTKVFELGMRQFASESGFILAYLDFLSSACDVNNIRALFNTVTAGAP